jgi:hypothetical protein
MLPPHVRKKMITTAVTAPLYMLLAESSDCAELDGAGVGGGGAVYLQKKMLNERGVYWQQMKEQYCTAYTEANGTST